MHTSADAFQIAYLEVKRQWKYFEIEEATHNSNIIYTYRHTIKESCTNIQNPIKIILFQAPK
jgi:hypothetical protein